MSRLIQPKQYFSQSTYISFAVVVTAITSLFAGSSAVRAQTNSPYEVIRLNNSQPIIDRDMFADAGVRSEGDNINGPSLIRVPNWIPRANRAHPSAVYYLYFGDHAGDYIRMAWAEEVTGPKAPSPGIIPRGKVNSLAQ